MVEKLSSVFLSLSCLPLSLTPLSWLPYVLPPTYHPTTVPTVHVSYLDLVLPSFCPDSFPVLLPPDLQYISSVVISSNIAKMYKRKLLKKNLCEKFRGRTIAKSFEAKIVQKIWKQTENYASKSKAKARKSLFRIISLQNEKILNRK